LQIKDLEAEKEVLMASNRSLAEFNLTKEPQLAEGKQHLQELSETGAALCQRIESKVSELSKYAAYIKLPMKSDKNLFCTFIVPSAHYIMGYV
jgi:ESCRT-I complex subunit VPS37